MIFTNKKAALVCPVQTFLGHIKICTKLHFTTAQPSYHSQNQKPLPNTLSFVLYKTCLFNSISFSLTDVGTGGYTSVPVSVQGQAWVHAPGHAHVEGGSQHRHLLQLFTALYFEAVYH